MNDLELTHVRNQTYFGAISVYEKGAIVFSGYSKISKKIFQNPSQDFFMIEKPIESRELKNPVNLRIPASFFKKLDTLEQSEIDHQKKLIRSTVKKSTPREICFESDLPVKSKVVSQFGSYRKLPTGYQYFHTGLDLRAWTGTPIYAMADGKVKLSQYFHVPGNAVIIDHGNHIFSKYFHLSELNVAEGTEIKKGTLIGKAGGTGRVEAPHLHWEITWRGIPMDPLAFLEKVPARFCGI